MIDPTTGRFDGLAVPERPGGERSASTPLDRFVLLATTAGMPLLDQGETATGLSQATVLFFGLLVYVVVLHFRELVPALANPIMFTAFGFVGVCTGMEILSSPPVFSRLFRTFQMFMGAPLIAALCRDRAAVKAVLWGYGLAAGWYSLFLLINVQGVLAGASAENFKSASALRGKAFSGVDVQENLNRLAFFCAQGWMAFLLLGLDVKKNATRIIFLGIGCACLIATSLTVSRSGILFCVIPGVLVFYHFAKGQIRKANFGPLIMAIVFIAVAITLVPSVTLVRFSSTGSSTAVGRKRDARERVYTAAVENVSEYWISGIGEWSYRAWAISHKIFGYDAKMRKVALGMHNSYLQTWVLWGLPGLIGLIAVTRSFYRGLPKLGTGDLMQVAVWAIATGLLLRMMFSHSFQGKEFTIGLGTILGSSIWIWPRGTDTPTSGPLQGDFSRQFGGIHDTISRPEVGFPSRSVPE